MLTQNLYHHMASLGHNELTRMDNENWWTHGDENDEGKNKKQCVIQNTGVKIWGKDEKMQCGNPGFKEM